MRKIIFFLLISFSGYSQGNFFDYTYDKVYTASGTNTYSISQPKITGYYVGLKIYVKFTNGNSTASTLQINALGNINLYKLGSTSLSSGDIAAGETKLLIYDGTQFQVLNIAGSGGGGGGFTVASLAEAQTGTDNTKGMTPLRVADVTAKVYNVKAYGAKGDGQRNNVGGITSGTSLLNSATANFVVGDIGKTVEIPGAGVAGAVLVTTITGRNSATQVSVGAIASTTVVNKVIWWGTDDTAAIQAAINACFAARATTVYLPQGIYIIAGALVTNDVNGLNPNSQLYIPGASVNTTVNSFKGQAIKLLGEAFTPIASTSSLNNDQPTGTILKSTLNQGTGTRPSIIGGIGATSNNYINKMNYTTMILEYINVMASSNGGVTCTNMIGVNALDQAQLIYRNGSVTMDCYLYENTMPDPSINGTNSAGVITGRINNNGGNFIENVWVQGAWHRGFVFGEHTYPKFTWTMGCHTAYTFLDGNFEIIGDIGSNSVVNYLEFPNSSLYGEVVGTAFVNLTFSYESSGIGGSPPAWLFPTNLLVDAGQNGRGKINYFSANGIDNGDFVAGGNQYGLQVTPVTRLLTKKFNSAGGAISSGYGTTVAFGSNGSIFEVSNSSDAISANNEVTTFIQSNKNNIADGYLAQRLILNNTGASGLAGDPNEKRTYLEIFQNDGATLNGKRIELIFTNSLKQITEQTGDQLQWFTNNTERFRIASAGQFGLGGANYGSSGQVLTSQGSGSAPIWAMPNIENVLSLTASSIRTSSLVGIGGNSGTVTVRSGDTDAGTTGLVTIATGDNTISGTIGSVDILTGTPTSGTQGSVNVQKNASGKISFFNASPVVKQSAVSTSQGIADALTAYGLLPASTISSGSSSLPNFSTVTTNTTLSISGTSQIVRGNTTSASVTTTLPTAVGNSGYIIVLKRISDGTNTWIIDGNGSETIDGALTAVLTVQYESITIFSNGTNWEII